MPVPSSQRLVVAGVLIAAGGVCYSSWVFEFAFPSPLDPMRSFLSELDAAHRPHREIYVAGDLITATCALLAAAVLQFPRPAVRGVIPRIAIGALAVFGAATLADALLPIECIPGIDAGCPAEATGLLPQLHHQHALTSTLAVFAIFTAMIAATLAAFRGTSWPLLRTVGAVLLVGTAMSTVWMLAADNLNGDFRLGLAQRIQVGGMSAWLLLSGWSIARQAEEPADR